MRKNLILACVALVALAACSNDDDKNGNFGLEFKAVKETSTLKAAVLSDFDITDFNVMLGEVEFEFDQNPDNPAYLPEEVEYRGPFEFAILKGKQLGSITLPEISLPVGPLEEIEFDIEQNKSLPTSHSMYGKTVLIKGTYKGTPIEIWDNREAELEIDYETEADRVILTSQLSCLDVKVNVNGILASLVAAIDPTKLVDTNKDGKIQVGPGSPDKVELSVSLAELIDKSSSLDKN